MGIWPEGLETTRYDDIVVYDLPTTEPDRYLEVDNLKQYSPQWKDLEYDSASSWAPLEPTIESWGCALTSASMVLRKDGNFILGNTSLQFSDGTIQQTAFDLNSLNANIVTANTEMKGYVDTQISSISSFGNTQVNFNPDDNPLITAPSQGCGAISKYNSNGSLIWVKFYPGQKFFSRKALHVVSIYLLSIAVESIHVDDIHRLIYILLVIEILLLVIKVLTLQLNALMTQ
jgi:hypothetical protein